MRRSGGRCRRRFGHRRASLALARRARRCRGALAGVLKVVAVVYSQARSPVHSLSALDFRPFPAQSSAVFSLLPLLASPRITSTSTPRVHPLHSRYQSRQHAPIENICRKRSKSRRRAWSRRCSVWHWRRRRRRRCRLLSLPCASRPLRPP